MRISLAAIGIALLLGCGGASLAPPSGPLAAGEADVAPYPYTVDQIRAGCRGRTIEYRSEALGKAPTTERWVFSDIDADTVRIVTTTFALDGAPVGAAESESARWTELHEHARFPRAATTIERESITVPAGTFESARYVVREGDVVRTFWFGADLAGPPVKLTVVKAGTPVVSMTMLSTRR